MAKEDAIQRSDPFIELPTRIFLTGEGLRLFSKNPAQLEKSLNRDGIRKEGLVSSKYNAVLVQKLVLNSYAEEILLKHGSVKSKRHGYLLEEIDKHDAAIIVGWSASGIEVIAREPEISPSCVRCQSIVLKLTLTATVAILFLSR